LGGKAHTSYAYANGGTDIFNGKPMKGVFLLHWQLNYFTIFTLMHDDIMDEAPLRRGQPTVHEKWDINTGILSGDAMLIQAYQSLGSVSRSFVWKTDTPY